MREKPETLQMRDLEALIKDLRVDVIAELQNETALDQMKSLKIIKK